MPLIKGVWPTKKQVFRQHMVENRESCATILKQNLAPPPQPKDDKIHCHCRSGCKIRSHRGHSSCSSMVFYTNAPKDAIDKKSSLCRRVSEAAKSQTGFSISGSTLFDVSGLMR